jgi:hypothetical protein
MKRIALFAIIFLLSIISFVLSCQVSSISVSTVVTPTSLAPDAFDETAVNDHFSYSDDFVYVSDTESTFACVDARRDNVVLGTPGGDFGELVVAIRAYTNLVRHFLFE